MIQILKFWLHDEVYQDIIQRNWNAHTDNLNQNIHNLQASLSVWHKNKNLKQKLGSWKWTATAHFLATLTHNTYKKVCFSSTSSRKS